jgi:hypothetical protein
MAAACVTVSFLSERKYADPTASVGFGQSTDANCSSSAWFYKDNQKRILQ